MSPALLNRAQKLVAVELLCVLSSLGHSPLRRSHCMAFVAFSSILLDVSAIPNLVRIVVQFSATGFIKDLILLSAHCLHFFD